MFGVDKWLEAQNIKLESAFNNAIRKLESIFRKDAHHLLPAEVEGLTPISVGMIADPTKKRKHINDGV